MKILYVIQRYAPYIGGAELVFQEIGERLAREGHAVTVYTTDAWDLERFWRADARAVALENETRRGVYIQRFPVEYLPFSALAFPALKRSMALVAQLPWHRLPLLFRLARYTPFVPTLDGALDTSSEHFDLVHAANISLESSVYAAYRFARRKQIPFLVTPFLHLGDSDDPRVMRYYTLPHQLELLKQADAVIVMTGRERDALVTRGVAPERIHRIGAGVEPADLAGGDGQAFRERHGLPMPIVTYIGTAAFDKGTVHLIEAMQQVWQTHDAALVLAGSELSGFTRYFDELPTEVKRRVRRLGVISAQEKRDLLAACDMLVMPSRTDSFGIVYLEAWLYGKPVIGAAAGGVPDVIDAGKNGFLVKFGDVDALARHIQQLLDDPDLAQTFGRNGYAQVLHEMTWERQYALVRDLYDRLFNAARAPARLQTA